MRGRPRGRCVRIASPCRRSPTQPSAPLSIASATPRSCCSARRRTELPSSTGPAPRSRAASSRGTASRSSRSRPTGPMPRASTPMSATTPACPRNSRPSRASRPGCGAMPRCATSCTVLRHHNEGLSPERRTEFRGLDVYSLNSSIEAVLRYLDETDPDAAREARGRYGCLSPWQSDPAQYGRAVLAGRKKPCDEALLAQLQDLLAHRLEYAGGSDEAFFDAVQNARIARAAEHYYRIMYEGSTASWNLRDRHMFDTLQSLLERRGAGAKAVVWAHNSHIGNAAATAMGWQGEFNIGE